MQSAVAAPGAIPNAIQAQVQQFIAQEQARPASSMEILSGEAVIWRDACLELAQPGELCAQVLTPGYVLTLKTTAGTLRVHTDRRGQSMRLEPRAEGDAAVGMPEHPAGG